MEVILFSSPLQPQSGNKIIPGEKNYLDEGWLFIGRFIVGSVSGMTNKETLALFIYS